MAFTDRSLRARTAILAAARSRFAADGYDRATIRAIAADAEIDPAMIIRYFGGKRELFVRTADFDLQLPDLTRVPRESVGQALSEYLIERWEHDDGLKILLRTAVTDDDVAARMRDIFTAQLTPLISSLTDDDAEVALRAGLVATQCLGVALCRYVLRLPPVTAMTTDELIMWFGPTMQRYLVGAP
jgi:AcrR family transcriptional regulator